MQPTESQYILLSGGFVFFCFVLFCFQEAGQKVLGFQAVTWDREGKDVFLYPGVLPFQLCLFTNLGVTPGDPEVLFFKGRADQRSLYFHKFFCWQKEGNVSCMDSTAHDTAKDLSALGPQMLQTDSNCILMTC